MSKVVRETTQLHQLAEREADAWIGEYTWCQQAAFPFDIERKFRAMWVHGFKAGWDAARATASTPGVTVSAGQEGK